MKKTARSEYQRKTHEAESSGRMTSNASSFGTKEQWQAFFESQGEPSQSFFLSKKERASIQKKKQEKLQFLIKKLEALRTKQDINFLISKLSKLNFEDSNKEEDSSVKTGVLIDIDQDNLPENSYRSEDEDAYDQQKLKKRSLKRYETEETSSESSDQQSYSMKKKKTHRDYQ